MAARLRRATSALPTRSSARSDSGGEARYHALLGRDRLMDLHEYLRLLRRRWRLLAACVLVAGVAAWVTTPAKPKTDTVTYTATHQLLRDSSASSPAALATVSLFVKTGEVPSAPPSGSATRAIRSSWRLASRWRPMSGSARSTSRPRVRPLHRPQRRRTSSPRRRSASWASRRLPPSRIRSNERTSSSTSSKPTSMISRPRSTLRPQLASPSTP